MVNQILDSFIEHMTNNYYEKFSQLKFIRILEVCKFKTNNVFVDLKKSKEVSDNFNLYKTIKLFLWKFRFITRKFN